VLLEEPDHFRQTLLKALFRMDGRHA
jgi:hypothetical protein